VQPVICIYAALTDGRGKTPIDLKLVYVDNEDEVIAEAEGEIDFSDARVVAEIIMQLHGLEFPRPGEYRFQLFGNINELLMERRLIVVHAGMEKGEEDA
jgi:hypothetical protein